MNTLNFLFKETELKVYGAVEQPIFVVNDICEIIGVNNLSTFIQIVKKESKFSPFNLKGLNLPTYRGQQLSVVNERGLMEILFRSNSKISKQFRDEIYEWLYEQRLQHNFLKQEKIQELEELKKQLEEQKQQLNKQLQEEITARNTDRMSRDYNHRIVKFVNRRKEDELLCKSKSQLSYQWLIECWIPLNDINQIDDYNHYRKVDAREEVMEMNKLYKIQAITKMIKIQ